MVDRPGDTPLEKTNFPFVSEYQLIGLCVKFFLLIAGTLESARPFLTINDARVVWENKLSSGISIQLILLFFFLLRNYRWARRCFSEGGCWQFL